MTTTGFHLAQINIARLIAPRGDPRVAPFFAAIDRVNALAEASPGFVWRLKDDDGTGAGDATAIAIGPDPLLIPNMSVWTDAESLFDFVYRSAHTPVMAGRRDWFTRFEGAHQALWWVPAGRVPALAEGLSRLWLLDRYGPSRDAFTFKARFPAPGLDGPPVDHRPDPWCIGHA